MTSERLPRVAFYARVKDPSLIELIGFYKQDLDIVRGRGYEVVLCTRLRDALRSQADAYFCWWWHLSTPVVLLARLQGRPVVCTGAANYRIEPQYPLIRRLLRRALIRVSVRFATGSIAISEYEAADLPDVGPSRLRVIYPAVPDNAYQAPHRDGCERQFLGVTIAQLRPESIARKGIDLAVEAAMEVRKTLPSFRLRIVGPSTAEGLRELNLMIDTSDDSDAIELLGRVDEAEKFRLLHEASVYLQPSRYEGFGLAVAEAMACGAVPIVSAAGSLPEVVSHAGVVVSRDAAVIAEAIVHLLESPDALEESSAACQDFAHRYSMTEKVRVLGEALDEWFGPAAG